MAKMTGFGNNFHLFFNDRRFLTRRFFFLLVCFIWVSRVLFFLFQLEELA